MIETIVLKIGKAILSKLIYIGIGFLLALLLFVTLCKSKPVIVTIGGGKPFTHVLRDMSKPKFPYFIFIRGEDGKTDTFIATPDTPIKDFPIICDSTAFPIPIYVNGDSDPHEGIARWWIQGIMDSIQFDISIKRIKIKSSEKAIRLCGSVGLGYAHDGKVPGCAELGLLFKKRILLSGQILHVDDWYGIGWVKVHF